MDMPEAVYANSHAVHLSDKYTHIRTCDVLDLFQEHGWYPSAANGPKRKNASLYSKHLVRMRHPKFESLDLDGVIPELVVLNSHNGSWALRIMLGMFRMVCSNGMMTGDLWAGARLKHYNLKDVDQKIQEVTSQMSGNCDKLHDMIQEWNSIQLEMPEQFDFAEKALAIRWPNHAPVAPDILLEARRPDDRGTTLWKVFNRVQENLTQGGFSGLTSNNRSMKIGKVLNVRRDVKFNTELFQLAEEYAK